MTGRFLDRRQQAIHQYRSDGEPRTAERYGWLTLASLWVNLGQQAALNQDPERQMDFTATLITPTQDPAATTGPIPNTDLTVTDPRDSFGLWLADLAADAASRAVVIVDDSPLSSAIVTDALSQILSTR